MQVAPPASYGCCEDLGGPPPLDDDPEEEPASTLVLDTPSPHEVTTSRLTTTLPASQTGRSEVCTFMPFEYGTRTDSLCSLRSVAKIPENVSSASIQARRGASTASRPLRVERDSRSRIAD